MAFVAVTEIKNGGGSSAAASISATAANALFVLDGTYYTGAVGAPTLTVTGGGTWTTDGRDNQHFTSSNDNFAAGYASCPSATGGANLITATWGSGAQTTAFVYELSGAATSSILDTMGTGAQGTASPVTTNSLTNSVANAIFLALGITYSSGLETQASSGTGWTMPTGGNEPDGANFVTMVTAYKIVSSIAAQTETWTDSPSVKSSTFIACYKQAGGAAQDTPELYGRPHGVMGQRQMQQLLAA